ncbi:MAG: quinolinate synthase NadA [Pseudomonadota bacterium]|nr:quinolinate synthase [Gammaproteobacteria bacterium]MEE2684037.1 quinolinate synthase NadA [Pseudomonadota bacterium]|tara:strand:+ start:4285 stop:5283 length:999 start_codon:yes stop_codon:yes gene_type:complete
MRENLSYTPEVQASTNHIYDQVKDVIPEIEWPIHAPYIALINKLKVEHNAIILAHNYQTPEIYHGVADYSGDSLGLAIEASKTDADVIILCGVHFMAETAKIINPKKKVLIPDAEAGCSLASSITGEDVRLLKEKYPGVPVVSYVNTSADVKAETDICCTSGNAVKVVESLKTDKVIFLPDNYLGKYVAKQTNVEMVLWHGTCEVHERFTGKELLEYRKSIPGIEVIAHPECPPDVLEQADFVGSTSGMINYVDENRPKKIVMITECSMSDNVAIEFPDVDFVRPCNLCPHMKQITLPKILNCLENLEFEVKIDDDMAIKAYGSVKRMIEIT